MRGADGLLINQENGEQFQSRLWNTPSSAAERETSAIIDNWKVLGAQIEIYLVPASLANDREHRARLPGRDHRGALRRFLGRPPAHA